MPLCFQRSVLMYRLRECLTGFMVSLCILPPGPALYRQMVQKWFCCLSVPIIHPFSLHHEPEHCQPLTLVSISFYFQINFDKFTSVGFFLLLFLFLFFQKESHKGLGCHWTQRLRMTLSFRSSCFYLPSAGITHLQGHASLCSAGDEIQGFLHVS